MSLKDRSTKLTENFLQRRATAIPSRKKSLLNNFAQHQQMLQSAHSGSLPGESKSSQYLRPGDVFDNKYRPSLLLPPSLPMLAHFQSNTTYGDDSCTCSVNSVHQEVLRMTRKLD